MQLLLHPTLRIAGFFDSTGRPSHFHHQKGELFEVFGPYFPCAPIYLRGDLEEHMQQEGGRKNLISENLPQFTEVLRCLLVNYYMFLLLLK